LALLLAAVVPSASCIPFAVPPLTGSVGARETTETDVRIGMHVDAGFSPLQLSPEYLHRHWDATLSGSYDYRAHHDEWGAAIQAGPVFMPAQWQPASPTNVMRVMPQLVGRMTTDGRSAGARIAFDWVGFVDGKGMGKDAAASGRGEIGFGFYAEVDYRSDDEWLASAGITIRLPAAIGVVCCAK
jgi:hypothetical protein